MRLWPPDNTSKIHNAEEGGFIALMASVQGHLTPWSPFRPVMAQFQMREAHVRRSLYLIADRTGAEERRGKGRKERKGKRGKKSKKSGR